MRNTRKNSQKAKEKEDTGPLPESKINTPGPSSGLCPPLQSWHNGQKKKYNGTLSAAKSLFQSDDEEIDEAADKEKTSEFENANKEKPSDIEIVEPVNNKEVSAENQKVPAGIVPQKKKLPVNKKWNLKNFMEVDSPQSELQRIDVEGFGGMLGGHNGDKSIVYMGKGMKRSRVFVFDPEDSDEFIKFLGGFNQVRSERQLLFLNIYNFQTPKIDSNFNPF